MFLFDHNNLKCNNPLTKEPKLDRARRILPEWDGFDQEVRAVVEEQRKRSSAETTIKPDDKKRVGDEL